MQKIIEQNLGGSEANAKSKAEYTWAKNEMALLTEIITNCLFISYLISLIVQKSLAKSGLKIYSYGSVQ